MPDNTQTSPAHPPVTSRPSAQGPRREGALLIHTVPICAIVIRAVGTSMDAATQSFL